MSVMNAGSCSSKTMIAVNNFATTPPSRGASAVRGRGGFPTDSEKRLIAGRVQSSKTEAQNSVSALCYISHLLFA